MSRRGNFAQGNFYPGDPDLIEDMFKEIIEEEEVDHFLGGKTVIGGIAPHAGYIYCAKVAVPLFEIIGKSKVTYDTVVIINPNHTGYGHGVEIDKNEFWKTPFGEVEIDTELREDMNVEVGELAQKFEHSGEVLLPYLKYFIRSDFKILPICIMDHRYSTVKALARELYELSVKSKKRILVVASSDFTHFETREVGRELDNYALEAIEALDSEEFYRRVGEKDMSICGFGPIIVLMEYLKLAAKNPKLRIVARGDSGEINNEKHVVDYVSLVAIDD